MYVQMNKLYVLYDYLKNIMSTYKLGDVGSCSAIRSFLYEYKGFINDYQPTNPTYKNILHNFENKIKYQVPLYNTNACPGQHFYIAEIKLKTVSENEKHKESVKAEQQPTNAENQVSQAIISPSTVEFPALHANFEASREKFQTPRAKTRTSLAESEITHKHPLSPQKKAQSFPETLAHYAQHAEQQQEQQLRHAEIPKTEFQVDVSQVYPPHDVSLESPRTPSYSEPYPHLSLATLSKEEGGASSSVMTTITRALKDVDPVPVVGVSGGMGALFLLFRYTPVGAFFRGGRGRAHRIPRSFNGQFLGGFPDIQYYDVGHIGYGPMNINPLAE
ncbi:hypothetical protein PVBG_05626 [Plasmodium vivax Brazil I]|uniref:Uncharacterized protein n=1 Tax=Plasmodium vivax (strain Brazil I) TaxID=1033975 RepID=A0A0J9T0E3_PLAV1|nr:hypothetical protein PVBG_05626 [Plasmodium vivax Brazil I]